jgi:hypothetical protein
MNTNYKRWRSLFLFCLGLFVGTAFCMKWMEGDFLLNGKKFTIFGLELYYTRREMVNIFTGIDDHVRAVLRYHCYFDFAFMAGVYPGIAAMCMMARQKMASRLLQQCLKGFAVLQAIALIADIVENYFLLKWIAEQEVDKLFFFRAFSLLKWFLALSAFFLALPLLLKRKKPL